MPCAKAAAPEPPWDESDSDGFDAIDLENSRFVTEASFAGGGFEGRNGTVINDEESYQLDFRAGTSTKIDEPDFAAASGPFVRVTPALLVRTLRDRAANAHYLGEVAIDGETYDAIGFSMTVGPAITLYFDRETHLLKRSERIFAGAGLVQYEFTDYEAVAGIPFNRTFRLYLSGELNSERTMSTIVVNEPLDAYLAVDEQLAAVPAAGPEPLTRQEIEDGVWPRRRCGHLRDVRRHGRLPVRGGRHRRHSGSYRLSARSSWRQAGEVRHVDPSSLRPRRRGSGV